MRAYARKGGADEELWGVVGLIHDFDYEKYPSAQEHPFKGNEILKERGYSDEIRRAYQRLVADRPFERGTQRPTLQSVNGDAWTAYAPVHAPKPPGFQSGRFFVKTNQTGAAT